MKKFKLLTTFKTYIYFSKYYISIDLFQLFIELRDFDNFKQIILLFGLSRELA